MRIISGPTSAKILIVGEAPGENEERERLPFVGYSGMELTKLLSEAGIPRSACRIANVCNIRPYKNNLKLFMPETKKDALARGATKFHGEWCTREIIDGHSELLATIAEMPNLELILAFGNTALWATSDSRGITSWRGSQMFVEIAGRKIALVPTYHPSAILHQWSNRWIAVMDLKRAARWQKEKFHVPEYAFMVSPSYRDTWDWLTDFLSVLDASAEPVYCAADTETRAGFIACLGLGHSDRSAICIPFMESTGAYWSLDQEIELTKLIVRIFRHPKLRLIGQNWLYDRQYFAKHWGIDVRAHSDTMVKMHVCFPGVRKDLSFISSFVNDYHVHWKEESKDWAPNLGEAQLWAYNCKDTCATYEANRGLDALVGAFHFEPLVTEQMNYCDTAFRGMLRGFPTDLEYRAKLANHPSEAIDTGLIALQLKELKRFLNAVLSFPLDPASTKQVQWLCYEVLQLPKIWKKTPAGRRLTADKDAIAEWLRSCEPLYRPLLQAIADYRSLQVFRSTFALAPVDPDGNFRCSIQVASQVTFRWSTSRDAFGYGTNMGNLPRGDED